MISSHKSKVGVRKARQWACPEFISVVRGLITQVTDENQIEISEIGDNAFCIGPERRRIKPTENPRKNQHHSARADGSLRLGLPLGLGLGNLGLALGRLLGILGVLLGPLHAGSDQPDVGTGLRIRSEEIKTGFD